MFIDVTNLKKSYTTGAVRTEVLEAVGMLDKKHRFPRELSGVEQQPSSCCSLLYSSNAYISVKQTAIYKKGE